MLEVPAGFADVTPALVTAALQRRCPGAVVSGAEVGAVTDGTNRRASVRLTYARGDGPPAVFVKLSARRLNRLALVALGALAAEARLAEAAVGLPIAHPRLHGGGLDRRRLATVVVMDDVTTDGGRPNAATAPLSVGEVGDGLGELARLHGAFAGRPLPPALAFLRPWRLGAAWAALSAASLWRGLQKMDRLGLRLPVLGRGGPVALERQFRRSAHLAATGPQTVLHGDPHPGNTYGYGAGRTGFYDWQLVRLGHPLHDVGYFVVSSLAVEDRRAHEQSLLDRYLDELRRRWPEAPSGAEATARYRAAPAFGLASWLHTLAAGTFQPSALCAATLERFAAAFDDLDTSRSPALAAMA